MIKIAIIGTFSVGKTTLTRDLCRVIGTGALEIDENVRDITRNVLKKDSTGNLEPEEYFQVHQTYKLHNIIQIK